MQSESTPPAADAEVDKLPTTIEEIRAQTPPPAEPLKSPLLEALRTELRRLVDGDLDANLVPIEQVAARGRELLMTLKAPETRVIRGRHPGSPFVNSGGNYSIASSVGAWSDGGLVQQYPVTPTSPEQFGATAVRQMVSLVPDAIDKIVRGITQSPERLVLAITAARERGQDALADKLEARLLGDDAAPAKDSHSATPAPTNGTTTNGKATLPASTTAE